MNRFCIISTKWGAIRIGFTLFKEFRMHDFERILKNLPESLCAPLEPYAIDERNFFDIAELIERLPGYCLKTKIGLFSPLLSRRRRFWDPKMGKE